MGVTIVGTYNGLYSWEAYMALTTVSLCQAILYVSRSWHGVKPPLPRTDTAILFVFCFHLERGALLQGLF
jgi:hypothetical protein